MDGTFCVSYATGAVKTEELFFLFLYLDEVA